MFVGERALGVFVCECVLVCERVLVCVFVLVCICVRLLRTKEVVHSQHEKYDFDWCEC